MPEHPLSPARGVGFFAKKCARSRAKRPRLGYNRHVGREGTRPARKKKLKIGTRVSVKTKHYGTQTGTLIAEAFMNHGQPYWIIKADDHPRNIAAMRRDIKVIR